MWLGLIAGWILGSAGLYAYLVATAKEPAHPECMDCRLANCDDCPFAEQSREDLRIRRAA